MMKLVISLACTLTVPVQGTLVLELSAVITPSGCPLSSRGFLGPGAENPRCDCWPVPCMCEANRSSLLCTSTFALASPCCHAHWVARPTRMHHCTVLRHTQLRQLLSRPPCTVSRLRSPCKIPQLPLLLRTFLMWTTLSFLHTQLLCTRIRQFSESAPREPERLH